MICIKSSAAGRRYGYPTDEPTRVSEVMKIHELLLTSVVALGLSVTSGHAGPCSDKIFDAQAAFDAKLNAAAASGPTARESSEATLHHQPTPRSVAHAEENLGEFSHEEAHAFADAIKRARKADAANDKLECDHALSDAYKAIRG